LSRAIKFEEAAIGFKENYGRQGSNAHNWLMEAAAEIRRLELKLSSLKKPPTPTMETD